LAGDSLVVELSIDDRNLSRCQAASQEGGGIYTSQQSLLLVCPPRVLWPQAGSVIDVRQEIGSIGDRWVARKATVELRGLVSRRAVGERHCAHPLIDLLWISDFNASYLYAMLHTPVDAALKARVRGHGVFYSAC